MAVAEAPAVSDGVAVALAPAVAEAAALAVGVAVVPLQPDAIKVTANAAATHVRCPLTARTSLYRRRSTPHHRVCHRVVLGKPDLWSPAARLSAADTVGNPGVSPSFRWKSTGARQVGRSANWDASFGLWRRPARLH